MNNAYLVTLNNVTISKDGKTLIVGKQYADFNNIVEALKAKDFDTAFELADRATALVKQSNGEFEVKNGVVFRNGLPIHNVVTERILQFQEQGLPFEPLLKFLENLLANPSARAVNELYTFLENKFLPITEDGHFLAYKAVQSDYLSITSGKTEVRVSRDGGQTFETVTGKVPNNIGNIVEVDRNQVDDDASRTCSYGLHAGALEYAQTFGGSDSKKVVVKINPKDAVSVPLDHNGQKLRAARYEVLSDLTGAISQPLVETSDYRPSAEVESDFEDDDDDFCPDCGYSFDFDDHEDCYMGG
jgi:hypothetical protein